MSIKLKNLHAKNFNEIKNDLINSIPQFSEQWTNHNIADPGITLIELMSWLADNLLYRINKIPDETYVNFLRLVAGATGDEIDQMLDKPNVDVDPAHKNLLRFLKEIENGQKKTQIEIRKEVINFINAPYRAITEHDFETLTREAAAANPEGEAYVERAIIRQYPDKGKVRIIIVSNITDDYEEIVYPNEKKLSWSLIPNSHLEYQNLVPQVIDYLKPRKLIGTVIEVKKPDFTVIDLDIVLSTQYYADSMQVINQVKNRLLTYLNPLSGGINQNGWPYQRPITTYDLAQIIEETEGVKQAQQIKMNNKNIEQKISGLVRVNQLIIADQEA